MEQKHASTEGTRRRIGIWEGFIPGVEAGAPYKYHIVSSHENFAADKGDPYALLWQMPPETASVVADIGYTWGDAAWMKERKAKNALSAPISIYEIHSGSWRRVQEENNRSLSYRELADSLPDYLAEMGFTHVEFTPIMEHPFFGSWGYQTTGYFAPSSRYGITAGFHVPGRPPAPERISG